MSGGAEAYSVETVNADAQDGNSIGGQDAPMGWR